LKREEVPCTSNPELWFSTEASEIAQAKSVCQGCSLRVHQACQREGYNHPYGVFGGMSADDRLRERSGRAAKLRQLAATASVPPKATENAITRERILSMKRNGMSTRLMAESVGKTENAVKMVIYKARQAGVLV
jgi:hypothetical protein